MKRKLLVYTLIVVMVAAASGLLAYTVVRSSAPTETASKAFCDSSNLAVYTYGEASSGLLGNGGTPSSVDLAASTIKRAAAYAATASKTAPTQELSIAGNQVSKNMYAIANNRTLLEAIGSKQSPSVIPSVAMQQFVSYLGALYSPQVQKLCAGYPNAAAVVQAETQARSVAVAVAKEAAGVAEQAGRPTSGKDVILAARDKSFNKNRVIVVSNIGKMSPPNKVKLSIGLPGSRSTVCVLVPLSSATTPSVLACH